MKYFLNAISLLLFIPQVFSVVFIDLAPFDFGSEANGERGLRVVQFCTSDQKFLSIKYYKADGKDSPNWSLEGFNFDKDGRAEITNENLFNFSEYALRTTGVITYKGGKASVKKAIGEDKVNICWISPSIKTAKSIEGILNKFKKKRKGEPFQVVFCDTTGAESKRSFDKISNTQKVNSDELGRLGELASELTMLSFGYSPNPSKYGRGHENGFDGIFIDRSEDPECFLIEAKFWAGKRGIDVKTVMSDYLEEHAIFEKLKSMDKSGIVTAATVKKFIMDDPTKVFKLAYSMKNNGCAQCQVEVLDIQAYRTLFLPLVTKDSPVDEKFAALEDVYERVANNNQELLLLTIRALTKKLGVTKEVLLARFASVENV